MSLRVYIAGPYTTPDPVSNTAAALDYFRQLMQMGFQPYCPHLVSHTAAMTCQHEYERWMALCFAWVEASHVVLRLPGDSPGADREVDLAASLGIPVIHATGDGRQWVELENLNKRQIDCHGPLMPNNKNPSPGRPAERKPPGRLADDTQDTCQTEQPGKNPPEKKGTF